MRYSGLKPAQCRSGLRQGRLQAARALAHPSPALSALAAAEARRASEKNYHSYSYYYYSHYYYSYSYYYSTL